MRAPVYAAAPPAPRWRLADGGAAPLSEAELSRLWAGQRFPREALTTADGRPVRVLNPGRLNSGAGPDFLDAVILLDGRPARGDVELHVRASAFRGHGHHADPAYDGLVLHVVYEPDDGPLTLLRSGRSAPVAALAPWVEQRAADLRRWLEKPSLWQEPCRDAEARLGAAAVDAALEVAGHARFQARIDALQQACEASGPAQALWAALLDTLGAGGDRDGFRRLAVAFTADRLPPLLRPGEADASLVRLRAALLHTAGLGPPPPDVETAFLPLPLQPALGRGARPANRPERRLAALAVLCQRTGGDFAAYALAGVAGAADVRALVASWSVAGAAREGALLGAGRAQELVLNAVLPFAALQPGLAARAEELLLQLRPAPAYGKTAFLEANLRRPDGRRRLRNVLQQQGLLAFLAAWCSQGGCGSCPLS